MARLVRSEKQKYYKQIESDIASPITIFLFCIISIILLQITKVHEKFEFFGSSVIYKTPYLIMVGSVLLSAYNIRLPKWSKYISISFIPLTIVWLIKLNKDIVIFGHADKIRIYKEGMTTFLIPLLIILLIIRTKAMLLDRKKTLKRKWKKPTKPAYILLSAFLSIYITSFFIIDEKHPYMLNGINFMIVLHSLVQSNFGKTVFFDQVSQYGGYANILRPIWNVVDFNIFNVTILFGVLNVVFLGSLAYASYTLIRNKFLALSSFVAAVYFHFYAFSVWPFEKYFQVDPIRTFFPALSILLIAKISSTKMLNLGFGLIAGLGALWNIETGMAIFLGYVMYVAVGRNLSRSLKNILTFSTYTLLTTVATLALFTLLSQKQFKFELLIRPLNMYGASGKMANLELNKTWLLILFVYIMCAWFSNRNKQNLHPMHHHDNCVALYLSFLGISLLSYHVLRLGQHDSTLGNSAYLFPILAAYVIEKMYSNITLSIKNETKSSLKNFIKFIDNLTLFTIALLLQFLIYFSTISMLLIQKGSVVTNEERFWEFNSSSSKQLYDYEKNGDTYFVTVSDRLNGVLSPYEKRMEYAKKLKKSYVRSDLLILSPFDSMLYFHANAQSPVSWANWWHAWTKDFDEARGVLQGRNLQFVLVERSPGINTEPFAFHPLEFDREVNFILQEEFHLIDSVIITKIWHEGKWENVYFDLYKRNSLLDLNDIS